MFREAACTSEALRVTHSSESSRDLAGLRREARAGGTKTAYRYWLLEPGGVQRRVELEPFKVVGRFTIVEQWNGKAASEALVRAVERCLRAGALGPCPRPGARDARHRDASSRASARPAVSSSRRDGPRPSLWSRSAHT